MIEGKTRFRSGRATRGASDELDAKIAFEGGQRPADRLQGSPKLLRRRGEASPLHDGDEGLKILDPVQRAFSRATEESVALHDASFKWPNDPHLRRMTRPFENPCHRSKSPKCPPPHAPSQIGVLVEGLR